MMTLSSDDKPARVFDPASLALAGVILTVGLLTSFTHVRDVAHEHGWSGLTAWAPPVVTELLAAASAVNIRWRLKHDIKNLAFPVAGVLLGLALSLAANEATATDGVGPSFARLPWGSILALLMPGSAFLVLMMVEPMFSRAHADRAAQTAHAQAVDILTVVRGEIGKITSTVHAQLAAVAEEAHARTAKVDEESRARTAKLDAEGRARTNKAHEEFRARTAQLDAESRARTDAAHEEFCARIARLDQDARARMEQIARDARTQTGDLAGEVRAQMAEVAETVTDLVASVIRVDASVSEGTAHRDVADRRLDTTLTSLTSGVTDLVQRADRAHSAGKRLDDGLTEVGIRLDEFTAGVLVLGDREQERTAVLGQLTTTISGLRRDLTGSQRPARAVASPRPMRAVTSGAQPIDRARTEDAQSTARARTSARTEMRRDEPGRISADDFIKEVVGLMRADAEWTPDYDALEARTGYKLRWLQMRIKDARDYLDAHPNADENPAPNEDVDEIADAEILEESAA